MRLVFDAYDPALRSPNGNYWAWCSTEIAVATADEARALIARHHHCDAPNSLGPDDLHGGCLGLSPTWLCLAINARATSAVATAISVEHQAQ